MSATVETLIKPSEYHDSVSLMLVARALTEEAGILDAAVVMATEANKVILSDADLLTPAARSASANDLIIAVRATDQAEAVAGLSRAEALLQKKAAAMETADYRPKSIHAAMAGHPDLNVAVISVAGRYAADEAWDALTRGLHVLLFSDNVSLEDEIALKRYASDHGLLLMGPGAGTTILNQVALGFANVLPAGPVGLVSAAGTGLQEVSTLLARMGVGITQGLGVGGRDLSDAVGGIMMLDSLRALQTDPATEVITLISKPPSPEVTRKVLAQVGEGGKPTVICFLGGDPAMLEGRAAVIPAHTLQEAALLAAQATGMDLAQMDDLSEREDQDLLELAGGLRATLGPGQRYIRGLYSGGTLCYEAQVIWRDVLPAPVASNAPLPGGIPLADALKSEGHTAIDLGEEEFTVGRPHPMIDNDLRLRRIWQEAADPGTGVLILDVVLGYGAHPDPASELGPALAAARALAEGEERGLATIASVTGTEEDPQGLAETTATLESHGVIVCDSHATAARLAAMVVV